MLCHFHLLDDFTKRRSISGPVFTAYTDLLCVLPLANQSKDSQRIICMKPPLQLHITYHCLCLVLGWMIYFLTLSSVPMLKALFFSEPLYKTSNMHKVAETCGGRQAYCGEYQYTVQRTMYTPHVTYDKIRLSC